jgi:hypothetical protein
LTAAAALLLFWQQAAALELRLLERALAPVSSLVPRFAAPFRFFFRQGFYQTKPFFGSPVLGQSFL